MILGLLAGGVLRQEMAPSARVRRLAIGVAGVASGWLLGALCLSGRQTHLDAELRRCGAGACA